MNLGPSPTIRVIACGDVEHVLVAAAPIACSLNTNNEPTTRSCAALDEMAGCCVAYQGVMRSTKPDRDKR